MGIVKFPVRFQIAIMMFWHCFAIYMITVNMSANILAMSKDGIPRPNTTRSEQTETHPSKYYSHYYWTATEERNLLAGFYYGYITTSLFGGTLCESYGPRDVVGVSLTLNVLLTLTTPFWTGSGYWTLLFCRMLNGMFAGFGNPGIHTLIAHWAPPVEKGLFVATIVASSISLMLTSHISGFIGQIAGWDWSFYACGIICLVITIFWFIIVADTPAKHWYIQSVEREYIENSLEGLITYPKEWAPYKKIVFSVEFFATNLLHFGHMWNLFFLLTSTSRFYIKGLGISNTLASTFCGIPYLIRSVAVFGFAVINDRIKRHEVLSPTNTRKIFCAFSHIAPAFLLLLAGCFIDESLICVPILSLSMGLNSAAVATNLISVQDLAPNFAGTLYGIMHFFGHFAGFLAPLMVATIVRVEDSLSEWRDVFVLNAFIYLIPGVVFLLIGSGDLQPWNQQNRPQIQNP